MAYKEKKMMGKRKEKELNIIQMGKYVMKEILSMIIEKEMENIIQKMEFYIIQENG